MNNVVFCWDSKSEVMALFTFCRDLFNAAFVSCWSELTEDQQDGLVNSLEQALKSQNIQQITQTLLNLSEFMEHCEIKVNFFCLCGKQSF